MVYAWAGDAFRFARDRRNWLLVREASLRLERLRKRLRTNRSSGKSPLLAREFLKSVQMREPSGPRVQLAMFVQMLLIWMASWFQRRSRPPEPPQREEFLRSLADSNVRD